MGGYVTINPTPAGDITGSGTTNYLAMFTSTNSVGDSVIYQSGSKVYFSAANTFTVNTATPSFSVGYDSQTITIAGVSYLSTQSSYINVGTSVNHQSMAASATASVSSVQIGARSRGTFAAPTAVQSGDSIYSFYSVGHDGTDYAIATAIEHIVGGTVGANQVPGKIKFSTANSSGTLTEAMSIYSTQQVSIGNYATPSAQRLVTIGQDTAYGSFGSRVGSTGNFALYNVASPDSSNWSISCDGTTLTALNNPSLVAIRISNNNRISVNNSFLVFSPGTIGTGAITPFDFTVPANTGQTASTEISNFKITGASKTWAAGTITTQRWNYLTANTAAFASASTITTSYGLYVEKATAGTNATITNNYALGLSGPIGLASSTLFSTAVAGAIEYNGEFFVTDGSGARKSVLGKLYNQTTSVTVANTVTQTSLLTSTTTLPANFFISGKQIVVRLRGYHSATGSPTIRIRVKLGSTVLLDTGVIVSGNSTNDYFDVDGVICCRTAGASGVFMGQGFYTESGGGGNDFGMVNTSTITVDTTTSQVFDITAEWGTASVNNTITATNGYIFVP